MRITVPGVALIICLQFISAPGFSQQIPKNKYGLPVVNDVKLYNELVAVDSNKKMIDLQTMIPALAMDVKYATTNNFSHRKLYPYAKCFFRSDAAKALKAVEDDLNKMNLGLKVFDSYRPYSVTVQMWDVLPDSTYLATPWNGSGHNCGAAIDLTLINLKTGKELPMPSAYDEPTERAWHSYSCSDSARTANRTTLRSVMEQHGFVIYPYEWWHYFFGADWKQRYEMLDLSFDELTILQPK